MQKATGNKIRLGIFITAGIVVFIAGIYFIGERQQMFSKTFHLSCVFKDVSGLQAGNNIRFSGLNVGIVEDIEQITDSTVKVDMRINEKTRKFIKKNAKATIGSDGLMGSKIIAIIPGTLGSPVIVDNDVIVTSQPITMDDILVKIKVTADNAADITTDLAAIMGNIKHGRGTIGKFISDTAFAKNIDQTVVNLKKSSKGLDQNMEAAKHSFLLKGFFKKKHKKDKEKESDNDNDKNSSKK